MRAVTYLRVSGEGQISGEGFPRQRDACARYAKVQSLDIVEEFRDEGVTGKMELEGRSGLSACIEYVRDHQIGIVLCESSDRLARDMIVAEVIIREFQKIGVKVIAAGAGIDLTEGSDANPTAKLIRQILAAVSEFDRCVIVLKLRDARARKKARTGKGEGQRFYGEDNASEKAVVETMIAMHEKNCRTRYIANWLNLQNIPTRFGGIWHPGTVAKILSREKRRRITA